MSGLPGTASWVAVSVVIIILIPKRSSQATGLWHEAAGIIQSSYLCSTAVMSFANGLGCSGDFVSRLSNQPYGVCYGFFKGLVGDTSWT